jgi:hypothetical protein
MVTLELSTREQCEAYTNAEMVPLLRNLSTEFGKFFSRVGRELLQGKPIYWITNDAAPESILLDGSENGHVVEDTSAIIIVLRRYPSRKEDAYIAAHELEHILLGKEGFPFPKKDHGNVPLAFSLYAMIQDPLISLRLSRYGFKTAEHYAANIRSSLKDLAQEIAPTRPMDRLLWCCNIVGLLLDGEYSQAMVLKEKFRDTLFEKFPDLVPDITTLYSFVVQRGFDTPERQRRLLRELSRKYHLYEVSGET